MPHCLAVPPYLTLSCSQTPKGGQEENEDEGSNAQKQADGYVSFAPYRTVTNAFVQLEAGQTTYRGGMPDQILQPLSGNSQRTRQGILGEIRPGLQHNPDLCGLPVGFWWACTYWCDRLVCCPRSLPHLSSRSTLNSSLTRVTKPPRSSVYLFISSTTLPSETSPLPHSGTDPRGRQFSPRHSS